MYKISYTISSGTPNFLVHISPEIISDVIRTNLGTYEILNVPDGEYTLTVTDANGCGCCRGYSCRGGSGD